MSFMLNNKCLNNYKNSEEIDMYFGESEESLKNCNKCGNLIYDNGTIMCKLINDEAMNNKKGR